MNFVWESLLIGILAGIISGVYTGVMMSKISLFCQYKHEVWMLINRIDTIGDFSFEKTAPRNIAEMVYLASTFFYLQHKQIGFSVSDLRQDMSEVFSNCQKGQVPPGYIGDSRERWLGKTRTIKPDWKTILKPWYRL